MTSDTPEIRPALSAEEWEKWNDRSYKPDPEVGYCNSVTILSAAPPEGSIGAHAASDGHPERVGVNLCNSSTDETLLADPVVKYMGRSPNVGQYAGTPMELGATQRHAIAALCLHNHPAGFTWEDVELVRRMVRKWLGPDYRDVDNLAARIAALLPPKEE